MFNISLITNTSSETRLVWAFIISTAKRNDVNILIKQTDALKNFAKLII